MDSDNQIPVLVFHVLETNIPQNASVVDQYIDPSILLYRRFNDLVTILNTVVVGNSISTGRADFLNDYIGSLVGDFSQFLGRKEHGNFVI